MMQLVAQENFVTCDHKRVEPHTGSLLDATTTGCHFCHPIYHITVAHLADHPRARLSGSTEWRMVVLR